MSTKTLEQLQKEADAANQALEAGKKAAAQDNKDSIIKILKDVQELYHKLPDGKQLWDEEPFVEALKALGVRSSGVRRKGGGGKFDEAGILALLGSEGKFRDEVLAHFKAKKQNAAEWTKKLEGKIVVTKVKTDTSKVAKVFWRKV